MPPVRTDRGDHRQSVRTTSLLLFSGRKETSTMAVYPTYPSLIGCWFSLAGEVSLAKDQGMRWITDSATCTSVRLDWNSIEALDRSDANSQTIETFKQTPRGPELAE